MLMRVAWVVVVFGFSGCVGIVSGEQDGGISTDAGEVVDAGELTDAGEVVEAGEIVDAGEAFDAGTPDLCDAWEGIWVDDAFDVTPADAAQLQTLLNTHNVLRLAPGNYRTGGPTSLRLSSNQKLLSLRPSSVPDIVIAAGTHDARVRGLRDTRLTFEPGAAIVNNCFSHLNATEIRVQGATVERNVFVAISEGALRVDTSSGGVFRDNRFVKFNSHGASDPISIRGDSARQSGGNAFLLVDVQTPPGSAFTGADQRDISFVGVNAEAINWSNATTTPYLFQVRNVGSFSGAHFVGISKHGNVNYPALDLAADQVLLHRAHVGTESPQVRLREGTQTFVAWQNNWGNIIDDVDGGLRFTGYDDIVDVSMRLGGTELTSPPAMDIETKLHTVLSGDERTPWALPKFAPIPDATGADWALNRASAPDDTTAIEQLIADGGIAQLEARTYYISRPLVLGAGQGLIGRGAGKTAIVAKTNTIDLIRIEFGNPNACEATTANFLLAELTLQGGVNGIHSDHPGTQINKAIISHVTFRNMSGAGIFVDRAYGWDNNVFDYVNFVDCGFGFRQEGKPRPSDSCYGIGEWSTMAYVDKTVFYRNQFVRCGRAVVLEPTRANHLDAFIDSSFVGNTQSAVEAGYGNTGLMIASTVFDDNAGAPMLRGPVAIVNSEFIAGRGASLVGPAADLEGCTFRRGSSTTATIFGNVPPGDWRNPNFVNVRNSTAIDIPLGSVETTLPIAGLYVNNALIPGDPMGAFFTSLAYRTQGTVDSSDDTRSTYVLLNGAAKPGSQLLR